MEPIRFTIPLAPRGQKRTDRRAFILKGGGKGGKDVARVGSYKAEDQRLEEDKLLALIYEYRPAVPLEGPIHLIVRAFMPIPASNSKKWKAAALAGEIRPTIKPDLDNIVKHLKDCLNRVFWLDDKQVVGTDSGKYYGDPARWEVEIRVWRPGAAHQEYVDRVKETMGPVARSLFG